MNCSRCVCAGSARLCSKRFFGKMNSSLFVHPWSPECFSTDKIAKNGTECTNSSKYYIDISTEDYQAKNTVLCVLVTIMLFGGILTILSNTIVLFFGLTRWVNIWYSGNQGYIHTHIHTYIYKYSPGGIWFPQKSLVSLSPISWVVFWEPPLLWPSIIFLVSQFFFYYTTKYTDAKN